MQSHNVPTILKSALCATVLLLLGAAMAVGQSVTAPPDFGPVFVGTSAVQQVTLTAGLDGFDPMTAANFSFAPSTFSLSSLGTCAAATAANSICSINVAFSPTAIGP